MSSLNERYFCSFSTRLHCVANKEICGSLAIVSRVIVIVSHFLVQHTISSGLYGVTVERSLAIQKFASSSLCRSASR